MSVEEVFIKDLNPEEMTVLKDARSIMYQVYGEAMDLDTYSREHYGNPYRLSLPFSISYVEGKPVGLTALMGMRLYLRGEARTITQGGDVAVIPSEQGKGHFSRVFHAAEEWNEKTGESEFIIGLPNEISYPRSISYGWREVTWLRHYLYICAPFSFVLGDNKVSRALDGFWRKFLWLDKGKPAPGETLSFYSAGCYRDLMNSPEEKKPEDMPVPVSDEEIEQLWKFSFCHFRHDAAICRWKYSYNPDMRFFWVTLRNQSDALLGYALCHLRPRAKGNMVILDDYRAAGSVAERTRVYRLLFGKLTELGGIVEGAFVNEDAGDGEQFRKLRFWDGCKKPFSLRGGPLIVTKGCGYIGDFRRIEFRNIDSDVL